MNKELAKKILTKIEENPEQHDQTHWSSKTECGTTCCVAGWACILSGYEPVFEGPGKFEISSMVQKDGQHFRIPKKATDLLGLTWEESEELFYSPEEKAKRILKEWSE